MGDRLGSPQGAVSFLPFLVVTSEDLARTLSLTREIPDQHIPREVIKGTIDCCVKKKLGTLLDLCVSSLRRGHTNLLCIVPILTDVPMRESEKLSPKIRRIGLV